MFRKFVLPIFAIIGIFLAIFMVYFGKKEPPKIPPAFAPPKIPFQSFVAGVGIIEPASQNIRIGVPFPDLIEEVYVKAGDFVKKGKILFELDTRQFRSFLATSIEEEKRAYLQYEDKKKQFSFYKNIVDKRAISEEKYYQRYWQMAIARQEWDVKKANVEEVKTRIARSYIKAPMDGMVLQVNTRKGEFANVNPFDKKPLIVFGDTSHFHVRVDIDEIEAWKIKKGLDAIAFVRGNSNIEIFLEFVRIEPYIIPKQSLTSDNGEVVDTRVLQIIYKFKKEDLPVFIGQILDIYVKVPKDRE